MPKGNASRIRDAVRRKIEKYSRNYACTFLRGVIDLQDCALWSN